MKRINYTAIRTVFNRDSGGQYQDRQAEK